MRLAVAFMRLAAHVDIVNLHGFSRKTMLFVGLSRLFGKACQIDDRYPELDDGFDALYRLVAAAVEPRSQGLVPRDDDSPSMLQVRQRNHPLNTPSYRDIEGRVAGVELLEKPEALLSRRAREPEARGLGIAAGDG